MLDFHITVVSDAKDEVLRLEKKVDLLTSTLGEFMGATNAALQALKDQLSAAVSGFDTSFANITDDLTRLITKLEEQNTDAATVAELQVVVDKISALSAKAAEIAAIVPEPVVPPVEPPTEG